MNPATNEETETDWT